MTKNNVKLKKIVNQQTLVLLLVISVLVNMVLVLKNYSGNLLAKRSSSNNAPTGIINADKDKIYEQINPTKGYQINAIYGNLGPQMIKLGVVDFDKFKQVYERSGKTMPQEYVDILQKGSDKKIKVTRENSYFLLNYFWAVGLANKSKILDSGAMMSYGGLKGAGGFASTGGWTLAKTDPMDYYSKSNLIPLTKDQEALVESVSSNIYRPCCDNSTAFPDCNHGMALLGVLQLMAANGASEAQMYQAGKYFNAFWFPGNYYDLALYFKNNQGKDFTAVDPKVILSKDYSSATGWQSVKKWLADQGLIQQPPRQGGGCGV